MSGRQSMFESLKLDIIFNNSLLERGTEERYGNSERKILRKRWRYSGLTERHKKSNAEVGHG